MKTIFRGPTYNLTIKNLQIQSENIHIITESTIAQKDALFYKNAFGKMVNFEHNTVLPTKDEAETYLKSIHDLTEENYKKQCCLYYNEYQTHPYQSITNNEFKTLKKQFKRTK